MLPRFLGSKEKIKNTSLILSWALYDLANQFFAINIVSVYFVRWLILEKQTPEIFYSLSYGISMSLVAVLAPVLGTISDITKKRKPFLIFFTLLSIIFTMLLGFSGNIFLGLLFFAGANFGCQSAIIFYNALIVNVAPKDKIGLVSGLGRMFAYSGAILALYLIRPIVLKEGYQATFLPTGFFFLVFSLPCMIFVKENHSKARIKLGYFLKRDKSLDIFKELKKTISETYKFPKLSDFLKAAFFSLCAVNVIILFMSVYATRVFGLNETQMIHLVAFSTLFAILGSFASGFISDYMGYKRSLSAIFILWIICFLIGALAKNPFFYWITGALVGIALGSTWVVLRALAIRLVPKEKIASLFGLFNLAGCLSAIVGALFWGLILLLLSPLAEWGYRIALFSLTFFMSFALVFLLRLPR